jgi:hypothetical protein
VTLKDSGLVAGDPIQLVEDSFKSKALELDGEGVAYADGFYYVIGSHGHPRDSEQRFKPRKHAAQLKARIKATSQIIRISASRDGNTPEIQSNNKLRDILAAEATLGPFVDKRLENNGLTIEGIAVRNGRLFAGFRVQR